MADGYRAITSLLDRGAEFDGIFALTDSSAFGAMRALADRGVRVPGEMQIVGFDNVRASEYSSPRLTTIEPGNDDMADEIVRIMLGRLRTGGPSHEPRRAVMPTRLVLRETTR